MKLVASILSGSLVVISSLVDSLVDLMSGGVIWWTTRAVKKRNRYYYPQGTVFFSSLLTDKLNLGFGIEIEIEDWVSVD